MKFFLIVNEHKDTNFDITKKIADYLCKIGVSVCACIDEKACSNSEFIKITQKYRIKILSFEECVSECTAAVVIGGDGTILSAAKMLYGKDIPIIGINLGKVGYMTELETTECERLSELASTDNHLHIDERMMLSCNVVRGDENVYSTVCLNEITVSKNGASMIDIELSLNGGAIVDYQCDGIIASTPTGSTAYSHSAGGPIIDPEIECISVIPLCPYLCINSGPIIFSKKSVIEITYHSRRDNSAYVSVDGDKGFLLCDGDRVVISAAEHTAKLLRFKGTDFYKLLNTKLTNRISELAGRI